MPSVYAIWQGQCPDRGIQNELLQFLRSLAERHEARWTEADPYRPPFLEKITAMRSEGQPARSNVRFFDEELTGHILVASDMVADQDTWKEAMQAHNLPLRMGSTPFTMVELNRIRVRGITFRLYDPRELYPGEDWMPFVFLESDDVPFLNGRIAGVGHNIYEQWRGGDPNRLVDWYIHVPIIHLRYYLEEWFDDLMGWIKFFFIPDLHFERYEALSGYETLRERFKELQDEVGYPSARAGTFIEILERFEREADGWFDWLENLKPTPTVDSVRLVLPGWESLFEDTQECVWMNSDGDGLSIHVHNNPPAFEAPLYDVDAVRDAVRTTTAKARSGIVEVDIIEMDELPVVRSIVKKQQQPGGMTYTGSLLVLRQNFSIEIKALCRETGVTGLRDSTVFLRLGHTMDDPVGTPWWFQDPYDSKYDGLVLRNPSDDEEWDEHFPDHPLSRCRALLRMLKERVTFKDVIKTAEAFEPGGPMRPRF